VAGGGGACVRACEADRRMTRGKMEGRRSGFGRKN
jgi:hypothetical protein